MSFNCACNIIGVGGVNLCKSSRNFMTIGIDGNEANEKLRVGVNHYAFQVLWGLYRLNNSQKSESFIIYLREEPRKDLPAENSRWKYKILTGSGMWIVKKLMPELLKSKNIDVFYTPSHYLPPFLRMPSVCTIHDLGFLEFSEQFRKYDFWQLKYWTAISAFISKYIICDSRSTYKDIVRHYPFAGKKARVVYLGYTKELSSQKVYPDVVRRAVKKYKIDTQYLLFLGTLKPSKNVEGLITALSLLKNNYKVKLVIAGKKGWLYNSIFEKANDLGIKGEVIFTDYVDEEDKWSLIKGAKAFVLPSFWEGFGIDVVSAMALGVPVIVSEVGSLPEVAGDAGIYVDPYSNNSIAKGIARVLKMNKKEYSEIIRKGQKQAQKFSWNKTALQIMDTIKDAR